MGLALAGGQLGLTEALIDAGEGLVNVGVEGVDGEDALEVRASLFQRYSLLAARQRCCMRMRSPSHT
ncbi:MAG: hypothetical protein CSA66_06445 [Proteobacteria bacterium]|nr:MAG: hypothetical protein CSA66_06445 [Pseudomonadota bacterium]